MSLVLAACGFAVYGNALANPFHIDDRFVILGDERVHQADMGAIFTEEYWPGVHGNRLYRPLVLASFALHWAVSQEAWSFRVVNLLLHVAGAFGLFLLVREVTGQRWAALAGSLFWIVHPIHTMALNQIVDRADIASAACVLFAAWLYARDGGDAWPKRTYRPLIAAGLFAAGLFCKENAVTLVGVVLLLDICRLPERAAHRGGRWFERREVRCYAPLLSVLVVYLAVRTTVLGGVGRPADEIGPLNNIIAHPEYGLAAGQSEGLARWGTPLAVFGQGVFRLIWPGSLSWDYSYAAIDNVRSWSDVRLWSGIAVLGAGIATMVVSWRRRRWACLAVGITLVTYSVVSNTFILIGSTFAERYLYLPSAGVCMLAGLVLGWAVERARAATRPVWRAAGAAVLILGAAAWIGCGVRTINRNRDFASGPLLNATDLRSQPRSARLCWSVAADELNAHRYTTALEHAERATAIYPEYGRAWRIRGLAHWRLQHPDAALNRLTIAVRFGGGDENAAIAIADILKSRGDYAMAIEVLETFVREHGGAATALNNLAWYLITAEPSELRDPQRALPYARQAAALQPTAGDVVDTYVSVLLALGRAEEARQVLEEALERIPADDPFRPGLLEKLAKP